MFWGHFLNYLVLSFFLEGLSRFSSSSWSTPALRKKMSRSLTAPCFTFSSSPSFTFVLCLLLLGKAGAGPDSEHFGVSLRASEPRLAKMCAYHVGTFDPVSSSREKAQKLSHLKQGKDSVCDYAIWTDNRWIQLQKQCEASPRIPGRSASAQASRWPTTRRSPPDALPHLLTAQEDEAMQLGRAKLTPEERQKRQQEEGASTAAGLVI